MLRSPFGGGEETIQCEKLKKKERKNEKRDRYIEYKKW